MGKVIVAKPGDKGSGVFGPETGFTEKAKPIAYQSWIF
jgi:hypothetical protein